ncbi:MAG: glycosyltransferase family 2 protein [Candidatus Cryptobacteroides sp.]
MNDLVSIIVPIYNGGGEDSFKLCIESLIKQTYQNIEIIIVDDGSTDDTPIVVDQLADSDKRVYAFHTSNHGVSAARNLGICNAHGKYLLFVDSDDYVEVDYVKHFVGAYRINQFIFQDFYRDNVGKTVSLSDCCQRISVSCPSNWFESGTIFDYGFVWGKLFLRELIVYNNIKFEENIKMAEDLLFILDYICVMPINFTIEKIQGCAYHYVNNVTSLSHRHNTSEHDLELFRQLLCRVNKIASVHNWEISPEVYSKIVNPLFQSIKSLCTETLSFMEKYRRVKALKREYKKYLSFFIPQNRSDLVLKTILKKSSCIFVVVTGLYVKLLKK